MAQITVYASQIGSISGHEITLGICQSGTFHLLGSQALYYMHKEKKIREENAFFKLSHSVFQDFFINLERRKLNSIYNCFFLCIPPGTINIPHQLWIEDSSYYISCYIAPQAEKRSFKSRCFLIGKESLDPILEKKLFLYCALLLSFKEHNAWVSASNRTFPKKGCPS